MPKAKVFISYSSKDISVAEAIHQELDHHFEVWRDLIRLETDWSREIAIALADVDLICLLWSENSSKSKWVKHEWLTARALEKRIVLCLFPRAPSLPKPIQHLHGISFYDITDGCGKVVQSIEKCLLSKVDYDYSILPPKSYIPFNPNPHFTGRHKELLELYLKMIGNLNKIGINQVGAVGMGGIGKTQLAVEFASRFSFSFQAIYWIQASEPESWVSGFVSIARDRLQLEIKDPDKPEAPKQYIFALQGYFKENQGVLVVMDNVTEPKHLNNDAYLFGLTPITLGCDLLFTTRKHFQLPGVFTQPVNVLSNASAYDLLKSYRTPKTHAEEEHARSICNAVGHLPLAITLAGAYLREYKSDISFGDYREELARSRLDVIDIGNMTEEDLATRHVAAVGATLRSQWETLKDEDARRLFKLAGQFPESAIIPKARLGLLAGIRRGQSKIDRPLARAFNQLHSLSLIERLESDASSARLHPLVREFSSQLVPEDEKAAFRGSAAKILKDACFEYQRLESEIKDRGPQQIIEGLNIALDWWGNDEEQKQDLEILECSIRYSSHILTHAPDQLPGQLLGRLLSQESTAIASLLDQIKKTYRSAWLRPLTQSLVSPGGPLLKTLSDHKNMVYAVALTADGRRAVSTSIQDNTLKLWDLKSGAQLKILSGHTGGVWALALTADGRRAVSGSDDKTLKLWDLETGKELKTLSGHTDGVTAVAITDDDRRAISGSRDKSLKLWDLQTGKELKTLSGHTDVVWAVALTADGKRVISGSWDTTSKLWDLETGRELKTLSGHRREVTAVALTADGRRVISGSRDTTLKLWDLETGKELKTLSGHTHWVNAVAVTADGQRVISGSVDKSLKLWDLETGAELKTLTGHADKVWGVALTADGQRAISSSDDTTLKLWDLQTRKELKMHSGHMDEVTAVALTADGKRALSGSRDKTLKLWDFETGAQPKTLSGYTNVVSAVAVTADEWRVISCSADRTLKLWDVQAGAMLKTLSGHTDYVFAVVLTPDGRRAISCSHGIIKVWDLQIGGELKTLSGHKGWIYAVALTPDGRRAISGSISTIKVWDLQSGGELMTLSGHKAGVYAVAISADGRRAISGSLDKTLKVWDLQTGEELKTLLGHTHRISAVAMADDGRWAISGSEDKTLKVWDTNSGEIVATFFAEGEILCVNFSAQTKTIIAGDSSGAVHILRLENAE